MKTIGVFAATLFLAASAFGQGQINFNNRLTVAGIFAPVYGPVPGALSVQLQGNSQTNGGSVNYGAAPLLVGTGFTAALWGAATTDPATFAELAQAPFQTATTLPGIIKGPTSAPLVPWVPGPANGVGNFQVRAWDNLGGTVTTWAAALANPLSAHGVSAVLLNVPVVGSPAGGTPTGLVGLTSFNLTIVPEPSLIALGALGLGALLLRRRKA